MNQPLRQLLFSTDETDRRLLADLRRDLGDEALLVACVVEAALAERTSASGCDLGGTETTEEELEARLHRVA